MPAQSLGQGGRATRNQRPHVGHTLAPLLAEETPIALDKVDKEPLYLALEIGRIDIYPPPHVEVHRI
jgi:hypothetical protein